MSTENKEFFYPKETSVVLKFKYWTCDPSFQSGCPL